MPDARTDHRLCPPETGIAGPAGAADELTVLLVDDADALADLAAADDDELPEPSRP